MNQERFYILPSCDWHRAEDAIEFCVIDRDTNCPVSMPNQVADACMTRTEATQFAAMLNRLYIIELRYGSL